MERSRIGMIGKLGSIIFNSFVLLLVADQAHSLTGTWACDSGAWEDSSCWSYTDTYGAPGPFTPAMMDEALLISNDGIDRTVIRSTPEDPPYTTQYPDYMTIDATNSGTMTLVQTAGASGGYTSGEYIVGKSGTGTLVQEGGDIYSAIRLGLDAGSSGTYNLINGLISSEYSLTVGYNGNGQVNQTGGIAHFSQLRVADREGSTGTYNLEDGRLRMGYNAVADISWIGRAGIGVFNQSGGYHGAASGIVVGGTATGNGTYNMSGGEVEVDSFLVVGEGGSGAFMQTGGLVKVGGIYNDIRGPGGLFIGNEVGSNGTYELVDGSVTGAGAQIDATVGNAGVGVFNQSGGTFDITRCDSPYGCSLSAGVLNIATQTGSSGVYNLYGGSSTSNDVHVGIGGQGEFNQFGGSHTVNGTLTVADVAAGGSGVYTLEGGTLEAQNIVVNANGTFNFDGGSITTDEFTNGGTLSLGAPSVDTTIVGNYLQLSDGILELSASISLFNGFELDSLDISQTATLGGTLDFSLDFGFGSYAVTSPDIDSLGLSLFAFDLLSAETILGEFDFLDLPDLGVLDPFFDWNVSYILDDFGTDYVRLSMVRAPMVGPTGDRPMAHTPEPATLLLMVPALAGIGFASRKKKCA